MSPQGLIIGFEAIVPKQFDTTIFAKSMKKTLKSLAKQALADFELTTENWEEQVEFTIDGPTKRGKDWVVSVGTDNVIWGWVDQGTEEHEIVARRSKDGLLHFQPTSALVGTRTRPGSLYSGQIRRGAWVTARSVIHPGITARDFTGIIRDKFEREMLKAFGGMMQRNLQKMKRAGRPAKPPKSACFRPGHGC